MSAFNELTTKERALLASYVQHAADFELSHVSEDLDEADFADWTDAEKEAFRLRMSKWNCPDEGGEDGYESVMYIRSTTLVSYAAWVLSPDADAGKRGRP